MLKAIITGRDLRGRARMTNRASLFRTRKKLQKPWVQIWNLLQAKTFLNDKPTRSEATAPRSKRKCQLQSRSLNHSTTQSLQKQWRPSRTQIPNLRNRQRQRNKSWFQRSSDPPLRILTPSREASMAATSRMKMESWLQNSRISLNQKMFKLPILKSSLTRSRSKMLNSKLELRLCRK